jgi:hypothetical protein
MSALHDVPAEIRATLVCFNSIHLFKAVLADIADPKIAGLSIDGKSERVAEAVKPDFVSAVPVCEWVVWRNRVCQARGRRRVHIDAQDFS